MSTVQTYTLVRIFLICDFFVCKDLFQSGVIQKVEGILLGIFLNIAYKVQTVDISHHHQKLAYLIHLRSKQANLLPTF